MTRRITTLAPEEMSRIIRDYMRLSSPKTRKEFIRLLKITVNDYEIGLYD